MLSLTHRSERSPLLSLLAPDWLPVPADLLPTDALLLTTSSWEELWEELLPLSVSSQPPPTCPGHRWVNAVEKKLSQVHQETSLLFINTSQRRQRRQRRQQYFTFWFASIQVIGTRRHGHLYGCRRRNDGPVMVVMETDALLFGRGEDSAGHYLCSFLDLIQQWVTAGWKGKETDIKKGSRNLQRWVWLDLCECVLSPVPCFPGLYPKPCIPDLWEVPEPIPGQEDTEDLLYSGL